jgi:PKD repeat protein
MQSHARKFLWVLTVLITVAIVVSSTGLSPSRFDVPARQRRRALRNVSQDQGVVIQPSNTRQAGGPAAVVSVEKKRVRVGELVRFTLNPATVVTNAAYVVTVDFGDGTRARASNTTITHRYWAIGHYDVHASVKAGGSDNGSQNPPIPRVSLTANPTNLKPGGTVSFVANPSSNYPGIKYRFSYGDGDDSGWKDEPYARHNYPRAGTFLAYVDLGLGQGDRIKQVGGSVRQAIVVEQPWINNNTNNNNTNNNQNTNGNTNDNTGDNNNDRPSVQLSANPNPVQIDKTVSFSARTPTTYPRSSYRFVFGDGSSSGWQSASQATHNYQQPGRYSASVTIRVPGNRIVTRSARDLQTIEVTRSAPVTVDFSAAPLPAKEGQVVTFTATPSSADANLRYRFVFGDNSKTADWQTQKQASYAYQKPGEYPAYVEIGRFNNGQVETLGRSGTKTISVTSGAVTGVSPTPTPTPTPFGGGPTSSPGASPSPTGSVAGPVTSPSDDSGGNGGSGLPDNWWVYLLIALLLLFVGYQTYRSVFAPRPMLYPNVDMGSSTLDDGGKGLEVNTQVLMRPDVSNARYVVKADEGDLVRSVRRENV